MLPNLHSDNYSVTSPRDVTYNCIAWAVDVDNRKFWPDAVGYRWLPGIPQEETIEAFISFYAANGYEVCDTPDLEQNYWKIAIYCDEDGTPLHAAKQLPSGQWASKLGDLEDIVHDNVRDVENGLGGFYYGQARVFMRKPVTHSPSLIQP